MVRSKWISGLFLKRHEIGGGTWNKCWGIGRAGGREWGTNVPRYIVYTYEIFKNEIIKLFLKMICAQKKPYLWVIPSHPRCHCAYKIKWCQSDYDPSSRTLQPISHRIQVETGLSYVCIKVTVFLLQNPPFGPFPPSFSIMLSSFFPVAGWANMF